MKHSNSHIKATAKVLLELLKKERSRLISEKVILDKKDNHTYPIQDVPFNIPNNWVWCYLSEISIIQEGPGIRKHQYTDEGIQFLTVTNILEASVDLEKSQKYISSEQYKNYSHFTVNKGDIVTACSGGSWGKSAIYELDDNIILNTSTLRLRFFNDLGDNQFLYYLTKTSYFKDSLSKHITGQQPNYGYFHYSRIPIPLPPLPEQQRIVAILDEAFAAIAKAKANAQQNLQNAKELFESYLQGVFENKGEGWEEKTLGEIGKVIGGYSFKSTDFEKEGKYQVLRMGNVRPGIIRENENPVFINKLDESVLKRTLLLPNDVIITQTGTKNKRDYGFTVIIENENYLLNQRISAIRFAKNYLPKFFLYYSWTNLFKDQYFTNETGTVGQGNVGIGAIKEAIIPVVSLKTQQAIVQKLDALNAEAKKLESIYQQKINDLEELKKSVLQKAFAGELKTDKVVAV